MCCRLIGPSRRGDAHNRIPHFPLILLRRWHCVPPLKPDVHTWLPGVLCLRPVRRSPRTNGELRKFTCPLVPL